MIAELCSQERWKSIGKITIQTVSEPMLRDEIVDHIHVVVSIKDHEDKHLFNIACDPWGRMRTPISMNDCVYEGGKEFLKFEPDKSIPPYKSWIYQDMQEARKHIETTMADPVFQSWAEEELLKFMDEEEEENAERTEPRPLYTLDNSLDGYVDMQVQWSANPGIKLPPQRDRNHLTANNSPLAELLRSHMQI
jgi:hypothetical protein